VYSELIYALVAHVEDSIGTNMRCHTIALACVESRVAGLGRSFDTLHHNKVLCFDSPTLYNFDI